MILFRNGHRFNLAIPCYPPDGHSLPAVEVHMAGPAGKVAAVAGKVDTGAFRTMLNFDTARALGIDDPGASFIASGTATTATDEAFAFYVHPILVQIAGPAGQAVFFPLAAAFERVKRNLFGLDWLEHLCLAVGDQSVHFLKD